MDGKDKSAIHASYYLTAITFLIIGIIVTGIFGCTLILLNQNHTAMAQQEPNGTSFQIDNMTFSHHTASVNGIQLHYVIGGRGDPVVLLHGWPETWYEWRHVMPALAKNHIVIAPDLRGLGDSSKPPTDYDGKSHDIGTFIAYSYAAAHPSEVKRLAVMEAPIQVSSLQ